jgi:hypothetical protein
MLIQGYRINKSTVCKSALPASIAQGANKMMEVALPARDYMWSKTEAELVYSSHHRSTHRVTLVSWAGWEGLGRIITFTMHYLMFDFVIQLSGKILLLLLYMLCASLTKSGKRDREKKKAVLFLNLYCIA